MMHTVTLYWCHYYESKNTRD